MAEKRRCQRCGEWRSDVRTYEVETHVTSRIDYCKDCRRVVAGLGRIKGVREAATEASAPDAEEDVTEAAEEAGSSAEESTDTAAPRADARRERKAGRSSRRSGR